MCCCYKIDLKKSAPIFEENLLALVDCTNTHRTQSFRFSLYQIPFSILFTAGFFDWKWFTISLLEVKWTAESVFRELLFFLFLFKRNKMEKESFAHPLTVDSHKMKHTHTRCDAKEKKICIFLSFTLGLYPNMNTIFVHAQIMYEKHPPFCWNIRPYWQ